MAGIGMAGAVYVGAVADARMMDATVTSRTAVGGVGIFSPPPVRYSDTEATSTNSDILLIALASFPVATDGALASRSPDWRTRKLSLPPTPHNCADLAANAVARAKVWAEETWKPHTQRWTIQRRPQASSDTVPQSLAAPRPCRLFCGPSATHAVLVNRPRGARARDEQPRLPPFGAHSAR